MLSLLHHRPSKSIRISLFWCALVLFPVVFTCEFEESDNDDTLIITEDSGLEQDEADNLFVPTEDWKVINEGQHIPAGLHVRVNLQTGLKEAKLLDEDGTDQTSHDNSCISDESGECEASNSASGDQRTHYYGKSDRRGVINKRTKVFSREEVTDMLKYINDNNNFDQDNLPQLTSSVSQDSDVTIEQQRQILPDSDKENKKPSSNNLLKELPISLHHDVEVMLDLSRILANRSSTASELTHALGELEYYVHQIDNAKNLNVIGGLVLVIRLLNHTDPNVKSSAAHVLGSATQSNPSVQQLANLYGSLPLLCQLLSMSEPELVQRRALFALNSLLRGNAIEQINFIKTYHGLSILGNSFSERSPQVQLKAVILLTDFLNDELINSKVEGHHLELPVLVYNEVLNSGWCKNVPILIHSEQLERIEKGLLAMSALSGTCSFSKEVTRLKELVENFSSIRDEPDVDIEYTEHLLKHCRSLLRYIRTQNSDL